MTNSLPQIPALQVGASLTLTGKIAACLFVAVPLALACISDHFIDLAYHQKDLNITEATVLKIGASLLLMVSTIAIGAFFFTPIIVFFIAFPLFVKSLNHLLGLPRLIEKEKMDKQYRADIATLNHYLDLFETLTDDTLFRWLSCFRGIEEAIDKLDPVEPNLSGLLMTKQNQIRNLLKEYDYLSERVQKLTGETYEKELCERFAGLGREMQKIVEDPYFSELLIKSNIHHLFKLEEVVQTPPPVIKTEEEAQKFIQDQIVKTYDLFGNYKKIIEDLEIKAKKHELLSFIIQRKREYLIKLANQSAKTIEIIKLMRLEDLDIYRIMSLDRQVQLAHESLYEEGFKNLLLKYNLAL